MTLTALANELPLDRALRAERIEAGPEAYSPAAMAGLLEAHAWEKEAIESFAHIGACPTVWACESGEDAPAQYAWYHGGCRACVLAAAALAVNHHVPPDGVRALLPVDGGGDVPIRLAHLTAFYNIMRERHGLPQLLHVDDRVYGWGWS